MAQRALTGRADLRMTLLSKNNPLVDETDRPTLVLRLGDSRTRQCDAPTRRVRLSTYVLS